MNKKNKIVVSCSTIILSLIFTRLVLEKIKGDIEYSNKGEKRMFMMDNVPSKKASNFEYEDISYNEISEKIKYNIQSQKHFKGYTVYKNEGYDYLVVYAGRKTTGGYGIEVTSAEEKEDVITIYVKEEGPGMEEYVIQALTYPYTIIKFKHTDKKIVVKNEIGNDYPTGEESRELY